MAVVKADAYGHGTIPVSLKLGKLGVQYFGVAIPEEGAKKGVKAPVHDNAASTVSSPQKRESRKFQIYLG